LCFGINSLGIVILVSMKDLFVFRDEKLLRMALTHRSYVHENPSVGEDNERLEFLGDAILNFLSGSYLSIVNMLTLVKMS
jgi:ribonuclease III